MKIVAICISVSTLVLVSAGSRADIKLSGPRPANNEQLTTEYVNGLREKLAELEEWKESLEKKEAEQTKEQEIYRKDLESMKIQQSELTGQITNFFSELSTADATEGGKGPAVKLQMDPTGGVTYVRWGRTVCNGDATVLYQGYAAGTAFDDVGGSASLLCLHNNPQMEGVTRTDMASTLKGVEYVGMEGFSTVNSVGLQLKYNDMPCVVCHIRKRSHQLMIPAREVCPAGWTREYWGFLSSVQTGTGGRNRGSFECVDIEPEIVPGGAPQVGGRYSFAVRAACSAIPCPPYDCEKNLKCVVCSN